MAGLRSADSVMTPRHSCPAVQYDLGAPENVSNFAATCALHFVDKDDRGWQCSWSVAATLAALGPEHPRAALP
eukprot:2121767-Pyramimonas_sp.AAC.1